jgi:hypothetical protein
MVRRNRTIRMCPDSRQTGQRLSRARYESVVRPLTLEIEPIFRPHSLGAGLRREPVTLRVQEGLARVLDPQQLRAASTSLFAQLPRAVARV